MERFNAADIDGMTELFHPDAVQVSMDGSELRSPEAIRASLVGFSSAFSTIEQEFVYGIENGDWALMCTKYRLVPHDESGEELEGSTIEVLRKDEGIGWRYFIDHPSGAN